MKFRSTRLNVLSVAATFAAIFPLVAQQGPPLQRADEQAAIVAQSREILEVVRPVARPASQSTVQVWSGNRWVASGTVIGDGSQALTKWTEIGLAPGTLRAVGGNGQTALATVKGVYPDEDLALLQLEGARFAPVEWSQNPSPAVGSMLIAAGAGDTPFGVGVVSVANRVLREADLAFIGILVADPDDRAGLIIESTTEDGAARAAGLKAGDVLISLDGKKVSSSNELRVALLAYKPGDTVRTVVDRNGAEREVDVELTGRPEFAGFSEPRLKAMRRMGGPISVGASTHPYPVVLQTDMKLKPYECGGPVVDLDGEVIGISLARVDRTRSYVLSAAQVQQLLGREPGPARLSTNDNPNSLAAAEAQGPASKAIPIKPRQAKNLRSNLEQMASFLDRMDREMADLGE